MPVVGFIEEQNVRTPDQRRGEVEAASHATRVGRDRAIGRIDEVDPFEDFGGAGLRLGHRYVVQPADHDHVLTAGQELVDGGVLPTEADPGPNTDRVGQHVDSLHSRRPRVGLEERGEDTDQGGLACSVRPEQAVDLSLFDGHRHAVERGDVGLLVGLVDVVSDDCERHRPSPVCPIAVPACDTTGGSTVQWAETRGASQDNWERPATDCADLWESWGFSR